jgi:hypothetical protein
MTESTTPGWHRDPSGRHEHRFWDGAGWTDDVSDAGIESKDAVEFSPPADPSNQPTEAVPHVAGPPTTVGPAVYPPTYAPVPPPKKGFPIWAIVTIVLLVVALIIVAVVIVANSGDSSKPATTTTTSTTTTRPTTTGAVPTTRQPTTTAAATTTTTPTTTTTTPSTTTTAAPTTTT